MLGGVLNFFSYLVFDFLSPAQDLVARIDDELKSKLMDYNQLKSNLGQVGL